MAFDDNMKSGKNPKHDAANLQRETHRPECARCEALLADAVDELLEPAELVWFDLHVSTCMECQEAFAEAKRGAAWLEMLKTPRPEPSAQLLERILARTSGAAMAGFAGQTDSGSRPFLLSTAPPAPIPMPGTERANVLRFPARHWNLNRALRTPRGLSRLMFEPRLAMTAAMAFCSIALTMNMTGVRLTELHASDLKPGNLRHSYFEATASAARRMEGLRVVHVLESRVDDLRDNQLSAGSAGRPGGLGPAD
jgi:hypothetical protein